MLLRSGAIWLGALCGLLAWGQTPTDLASFIEGEMASNHIQAVSVALVDGGRVAWSHDFGTPPDTVYRAGSVSKLFTDIAVMQLVERGRIDLDAPVQRYLPEFQPRNPFGKAITLRHLMAHRSGLVREPPVGNYFDASGPSLRDTVLSLNGTELVYAPGERTKYSNAGVAVVGYVLEKLTGRPFAAYVKAEVLDPLGMAHSSFQAQTAAPARMVTLEGRSFDAPTFALGMAPAGSLYTTTGDLALFAMSLFKGGAPLIRGETLERMWTPQFDSGFGLGFRVSKLDGQRLIGHNGAIYGFVTDLSVLPEAKLAAIAIANQDGADAVVTRIAQRALRGMLAERKPAPPPEVWEELIGEYGWDYNTLYIHERGGKLTSLIEWFYFDPLEPVAKDVFRFPDSGLYAGEKAVFERGADGKVSGVRVGGVLFPRRPDPAGPGVTFRVQPVRPMAELLREALAARPPVETGDFRAPDLVEPAKLDAGIRLDIRYATDNNFMSTAFYTQARAFLQRPAAEAVVRAHRKLNALGYGILIHDAYRPWFVTKMFWEGTPPDKHQFVANPESGSKHNRGCAVDLTLYSLADGKAVRMTGGYDEMSPRSYSKYQGGTSLQRWQRDLLRKAMEEEGFQVIETEWWHFDYKDWTKYPILNRRFEEL